MVAQYSFDELSFAKGFASNLRIEHASFFKRVGTAFATTTVAGLLSALYHGSSAFRRAVDFESWDTLSPEQIRELQQNRVRYFQSLGLETRAEQLSFTLARHSTLRYHGLVSSSRAAQSDSIADSCDELESGFEHFFAMMDSSFTYGIHLLNHGDALLGLDRLHPQTAPLAAQYLETVARQYLTEGSESSLRLFDRLQISRDRSGTFSYSLIRAAPPSWLTPLTKES